MIKNIFENESSEKYYVLGWILSDGHVSIKRKLWTMKLHSKDKGALCKIQTLIGHQGKIYGPYHNQDSVQLFVSDKSHYNFLTSTWGLDNHKSTTLKWRDVPEEYLPHLVRGYYDGDGSCYTKQSNNPNVRTIGINFVGTHHFITGLRSAINHANGLESTAGHICDLDTYSALIYNGNDQALKILDWMYVCSEDIIRLDRKFDKYVNYKQYIESKTAYSHENKSKKYQQTITPNYDIANKVRFDYQYLNLSASQLSQKYNINRSVIVDIVNNLTHVKSDNRTKSATFYLTAFGETKHIIDWVDDERCHVDLSTLRHRISVQKLNPEDAIIRFPDSTSGTIKYKYMVNDEEKTISEILKDSGISRSAFTHRVHVMGMDPVSASEIAPGSLKGINCAHDKLSNNQKCTLEQVKQARDLYQSGDTVKKISNLLNISESCIHDIVSNRTFFDSEYTPKSTKSQPVIISYNNKTQTIKEWSKELGIPHSTIDRRLRMGLPIGQVLEKTETRLKLGKAKSDKDKRSAEVAHLVREDYLGGLVGKSNYEKHKITKSRYADIIGNRICKENDKWWVKYVQNAKAY